MFASQIPFMPAHTRTAPPPWAVLSVKCCVVGILALPPVLPLLLAGIAALVPVAESDAVRRAAFFAAVGVWVAMFVVAQYLITTYPPVPRR
jgi:hypothetical protein